MISQDTIRTVARRIADRFRPERIVLFGSYARGDATENSDIDLLVVMGGPPVTARRGAPIIRMLAEEFALPVDVVVRSEETFDKSKGVLGTLSHQVQQEGVVLYERGRQ